MMLSKSGISFISSIHGMGYMERWGAFVPQHSSFLLQIIMPRLNWRWLLALSSVPSFMALLFYGFTPESPRYLCMKGRITDTHKILEKIARVNRKTLPPGRLVSDQNISLDEEFAPSEYSHLLCPTGNKTNVFKAGFSSLLILFSSKLIRTTLSLWILFFGNAFSYYGIILLTSELSSGQSKCGSIALHSENSHGDSLYVDVFITSLAGDALSGSVHKNVVLNENIFHTVMPMAFCFPIVFCSNNFNTSFYLFQSSLDLFYLQLSWTELVASFPWQLCSC